MMKRLKSISVRDFRTIRGEINVPLDAPVVLIHGQNGMGKTSLLSALELGLTGKIASLRGLDVDFASHLVHKEAREGHVSVSAEGVTDGAERAVLTISPDGVAGDRLLPAEAARFYAERCYLSQATLGRLLELYQVKDARRSDSPLTKFVKDLLGLDRLDALIEGLHDSGDVRRLRTPVPTFWEVREQIQNLERKHLQFTGERDHLQVEQEGVRVGLLPWLQLLDIDVPSPLEVESLDGQLANDGEESELQRLAGLRRDAMAVQNQWRSIATDVPPAERERAEIAARNAGEAARAWRAEHGQRFELALSRVSELLPDVDLPSPLDLERSRVAALKAVQAEFARCDSQIKRDAEGAAKLASMDLDLDRARSRLSVLEDQLARHAATSGGLAQALSGLLSHVHGEDCPVCGRDFGEVSARPLQAHVSDRIAELTVSAGRLQALAKERSEAVAIIATFERDRGSVAGRLLTQAARDQLKMRRMRLDELRRVLEALAEIVSNGERLAHEAAGATRALEALRARDQKAGVLRDACQSLTTQVGVAPLGTSEALEAALERIDGQIAATETRLTDRQKARRASRERLREYASLAHRLEHLGVAIADLERRLAQLRDGKEQAEARILQARDLAGRARDVRTNIVRRVFNESLNAVWRDLFVRLAPEEPFVPAFALPENPNGPVEAVLETHYRSRGKGGDPRAMLSAGNLNTAALTLFLSLHLSVASNLPWLIIDDPVQSMDEVHIAQFAALLRTLSKQHGRQMIIAVHERPLFEYLALELSPAHENDRLITIELGKSPSGDTIVNFEPRIWLPDTAIAA